MSAITTYQNPLLHPYLSVPEYIVREAVNALAMNNRMVAALKLIRGAYRTSDRGFASLEEAKEIYHGITGRDIGYKYSTGYCPKCGEEQR